MRSSKDIAINNVGCVLNEDGDLLCEKKYPKARSVRNALTGSREAGMTDIIMGMSPTCSVGSVSVEVVGGTYHKKNIYEYSKSDIADNQPNSPPELSALKEIWLFSSNPASIPSKSHTPRLYASSGRDGTITKSDGHRMRFLITPPSAREKSFGGTSVYHETDIDQDSEEEF
jgi:hypothetical protein